MQSYGVTVWLFIELTCEFLREASRTQIAIFQTQLAVKPCSTLNASFFGSVVPLPPLPTIQTLLSLFVRCCFVWMRSVDWFVESITSCDESVFEFSAAAVMPVLLSTYGAYGAVKDHCFLAYWAPVLLRINPPLHHDTAQCSTVWFTLYSTMSTCVQVHYCCRLLSTNNYSTWCTDCITLVMYCCMTCTAH